MFLGACRRRRRRGGWQLYQLWAAWGATGQLSGIWLGLWLRAPGGAAQSASIFIKTQFVVLFLFFTTLLGVVARFRFRLDTFLVLGETSN